MIDTSLAVLALSASVAVTPLSRLVHLHPRGSEPDTRISITLHNQSNTFQEIKVNDHTYTVLAHRGLDIKAPAGTVVYADSSTGGLHRGEKLVEISSELNHKIINLK
jgi:hypothetical protein